MTRDIAINHATVREKADMLAFIDLCAARNLRAVSIWGDEIDKVGEAAAQAALQQAGMTVYGYNRIGPFIACELDKAPAQLEQAARFGADHVLVFTGGLVEGEHDLKATRRRHEDIIGGLLDQARQSGVKLALEPLHPMLVGDRTTLASLSHANAICDALGDGIGIVIDVHHVWWDERLEEEVARAGKAGRILGFHVNDWLVPTRHLLRDRGMMGDGIIDLPYIDGLVRATGFNGPVEVEIFSDDWAARDPAFVLDTVVQRCTQIFPDLVTP